MATRAIKKQGKYRLYPVEGWNHYEIWLGTKSDGIHVENISDPANFAWAIDEVTRRMRAEIEAEFGIKVDS